MATPKKSVTHVTRKVSVSPFTPPLTTSAPVIEQGRTVEKRMEDLGHVLQKHLVSLKDETPLLVVKSAEAGTVWMVVDRGSVQPLDIHHPIVQQHLPGVSLDTLKSWTFASSKISVEGMTFLETEVNRRVDEHAQHEAQARELTELFQQLSKPEALLVLAALSIDDRKPTTASQCADGFDRTFLVKTLKNTANELK